jgi:hypothetical protein
MTETSRFHDVTSNTDVHFAQTFSTVHLDGVDESTLNGLYVTESTPNAMTVSVDTGIAWVQGRWYENDDAKALNIEAADASHPRIDRIVLRSTVAGIPGNVRLAVKKGTAAASPTAPALTQTSAVHEILIADITIPALTAAITNAMITDARANLPSGTIAYVIDNGGAAITTGSKGYLQVPFACKVIGWSVVADQSGSIVVDIKSASISSWPATSITTASICAADKPTLSTKKAARNKRASTWTVAVAEGDVWEYVVDSATTVTRVTVSVHVARTN